MKMVKRAEAKMFGNSVFFVEVQQDKAGFHQLTMEYCGEDAFKPVVVHTDNDKDMDTEFRKAIAEQLVKHHTNKLEMDAVAWGKTSEKKSEKK